MSDPEVNAQNPFKKYSLVEASPIKSSTEKSYDGHVDALIKYSVTKRTDYWEEPALISFKILIDDFIERQDLSNGTKRTYRAALLWFMKGYPGKSHQDMLDLERLEELALPKGRRTGGSKPKCISEEDYLKLVKEIEDQGRGSIWAQRTLLWMHAGIDTGVRPSEWLNVQWVDDNEDVIRVVNGKRKLSEPAFFRGKNRNEDSYIQGDDDGIYLECDPGERFDPETYRDIQISDPFQRLDINRHLEELNAVVKPDLPLSIREKEFEKYFNQCRQVIYRACKNIWNGKKWYSLYTFRKQYSANMKAAFGSDATAVLMGHSSKDSPSTASYGKANQAHQKFKALKDARVEQNKVFEKINSEKIKSVTTKLSNRAGH